MMMKIKKMVLKNVVTCNIHLNRVVPTVLRPLSILIIEERMLYVLHMSVSTYLSILYFYS
jgi:hypothetical protein